MFCGCGIIYCWKRSEDNTDNESYGGELSDSESSGADNNSDNMESPTSTDEVNIDLPSDIATVVAEPISPEEFF